MSEKTKNIVILGAGFGGLRAALKLSKKFKHNQNYNIILIDKNSYQTYTPSLYEVATAYRGGDVGYNNISEGKFIEKLAGICCFVLREIVGGTGITFAQEEVTDINLDSNEIVTNSGQSIPYEYCVIAIGGEVSYYGVEGMQGCSYSLKSLQDALNIRDRIKSEFERAVQEGGDVDILVIGAGLSGFELATEIATYTRHLRDAGYRMDPSRVHIKLIDAGDKILSNTPEAMRARARRRLEELDIEVMTETVIERCESDILVLKEGRELKGDIFLWTGGIEGASLLKNISGIPLNSRGRIEVDQYLRLEDNQNVFALGDSAYYHSNEKDVDVPATAWAAEQEADVVADNIYRSAFNNPLFEYKPKFPGFVSAAGGKHGVAHLYGVTFSGFSAWVIKRLIDLKYILSIMSPFRGIKMWLREFNIFTRND